MTPTRTLLLLLALLLPGFWNAAQASEPLDNTVNIIIFSNGKVIDELRILTRKTILYRRTAKQAQVGGIAFFKGSYVRPGWRLYVRQKLLLTRPNGDFKVIVPIERKLTVLDLQAVGPNGEKESEAVAIEVPNWEALKNRLLELPDAEEELNEGASALFARRFNTTFSLACGFSYLLLAGDFQYQVVKGVFVGLGLHYVSTPSGDVAVQTIGTLLNASVSLTRWSLLDVHFEAGGGFYFTSTIEPGIFAQYTHIPFYYALLGGKSFLGRSGLYLEGGAGIQYIAGTVSPVVTNFSYVLPLFIFGIGYAF